MEWKEEGGKTWHWSDTWTSHTSMMWTFQPSFMLCVCLWVCVPPYWRVLQLCGFKVNVGANKFIFYGESPQGQKNKSQT